MYALLSSALDKVKDDIAFTPETHGSNIWQTYVESIENGGNCEDSCLAMQEILLGNNISDHRIHLIAGKLKKDPNVGKHHMALLCDSLVLDVLEDKPKNANDYFYKIMAKTYVLSYTGLYIKGVKWCERDQVPRWMRYQNQLLIEHSLGNKKSPV